MRDHHGFTLIEVLVVIVLVGVLSGLAIAQYASFRARGFDSQVAATVRGIATGEEAYYAENRTYVANLTQLDGMVTGNVRIAITAGNSGTLDNSFRVVGTRPGTQHSFEWLSDPTPGSPNLIEN